jgi:hypothetical protein
MMAARDSQGRRLWRTEAQALEAQLRSIRDYGIASGVTKTGAYFHLLYDPEM